MKELSTHLKKDEIAALCERIKMPFEVTKILCRLIGEFDFSAVAGCYPKLFSQATGDEAVKEINAALENAEEKGFIWLTLYLAAALETKTIYDALSIDEAVFYDTMAAFTRFVTEHKSSFGSFGYDRQFWTYRQIACVLFRIGVLEYEMITFSGEDAVLDGETVIKTGERVLSVHIPSDARITPEHCKASLRAAVDFFEKHFAEFDYQVFFCQSWIISPNLKEVLSENSNIVKFLELFEIYAVFPESQSYKAWVFGDEKLSIDEFPQETSLQRNIVKHLKQGGKIGEAAGIIRKTSL